jgi:hypothetical protein
MEATVNIHVRRNIDRNQRLVKNNDDSEIIVF